MNFLKTTSDENETVENVVYVFIDASNVWAVQKTKGALFDYQKLQIFIQGRFGRFSMKVFYYTSYPANGTREYSLDKRHKFLTYLKRGLNFIVRKKELKRIKIITEDGEAIQEKGNMDVEITIDAMHDIRNYDTAIFFTGDSDFLALVSYLRRNGKKVYIFSSKNNISRELRTGGDGYFDVLNIQEDIWRGGLKHRSK